MARAEKTILELADGVDDVVRDMEMIVINMADRSKRSHEVSQARRARALALAVRAAVAESRLLY